MGEYSQRLTELGEQRRCLTWVERNVEVCAVCKNLLRISLTNIETEINKIIEKNGGVV